jgi:hypothetical protein
MQLSAKWTRLGQNYKIKIIIFSAITNRQLYNNVFYMSTDGNEKGNIKLNKSEISDDCVKIKCLVQIMQNRPIQLSKTIYNTKIITETKPGWFFSKTVEREVQVPETIYFNQNIDSVIDSKEFNLKTRVDA